MGCRTVAAMLSAIVTLMGVKPSIGQELVGGSAPSLTRHFTVKDDIEMSDTSQEMPAFSPDGNYFFVETTREVFEKDGPEDTIWIWSTKDVDRFVRDPQVDAVPTATPLVRMASYKSGPIVANARWLDDSSGVAFLGATPRGTYQLFKVTLATKKIEAMTPDDVNVNGFSISGDNVLYSITDPEMLRSILAEDQTMESQADRQLQDVTGMRLKSLLFPQSRYQDALQRNSYSELWRITHGKSSRVEDSQSHQPIHVYVWGPLSGLGVPFKLSQDGDKAVIMHPVKTIPAEWTQYAAPTGYSGIKQRLLQTLFKPGAQSNLGADPHYEFYIDSYQLLDLSTGTFSPLINAPTGKLFDWNSQFFTPAWSADGEAVLLPDTFLPITSVTHDVAIEHAKHPCISVFDLKTQKASCVLPIIAGLDKQRYALLDVKFDPSNRHRVLVEFHPAGYLPTSKVFAAFRQIAEGSWTEDIGREHDQHGSHVEVTCRQSLNEPPTLVGTDKSSNRSRTLWNMNPQLEGIKWGDASVITWQDETGHTWKGGLIRPPDYVPGKRYPLVIQTHGFNERYFLTHGFSTTGFAARELAASGMVVLQADWNANGMSTTTEARNQVSGFANVVEKLVREGLVDPDKVGMIGFSRTVYHTYAVMAAGMPKLAAASVIEGVNYGYWQTLMYVSENNNASDSTQVIGAEPTGEGLKVWLEHSPIFNLSQVTTPLLMLETGKEELLFDWEPYAILYSLHKPVDLLLLQPGTHVETNPQQRLATQGTNVDWFRFWLQDYEDPDPAKKEQYKRWEHLKELQDAEDKAAENVNLPKPQ